MIKSKVNKYDFMANKSIKIKIKSLDKNDRDYKNLYNKVALITKRLSKLFPRSPKYIKVCIFQNRRLFLQAINKPRASGWLKAYIPPNSTSNIYLFLEKNKSLKQKESSRLLTHEIAHLYINALNPKLPDWIKEGTAVYLSRQMSNFFISEANWNAVSQSGTPFQHLRWSTVVKHNGYQIAGLLVLFFVKNIGWPNFITSIATYKPQDSLLKILTVYSKQKSEKILLNNFKNIFVNKKRGE